MSMNNVQHNCSCKVAGHTFKLYFHNSWSGSMFLYLCRTAQKLDDSGGNMPPLRPLDIQLLCKLLPRCCQLVQLQLFHIRLLCLFQFLILSALGQLCA